MTVAEQPTRPFDRTFLSVAEIADVMDRDRTTVTRWIRNGRLRACQPNGPGTHYLVDVRDLEAFLNAGGVR